jgi:hypothetical protein
MVRDALLRSAPHPEADRLIRRRAGMRGKPGECANAMSPARAKAPACGKTAVESVVETAPFLANHRDAVKEFILTHSSTKR